MNFQKSVLPGLASLSRHEGTEDLQMFGRNGGARRRRRAVVESIQPAIVCTPLIQQFSSIEACLEDRSLTGWGKMRQRCPAGNPPTALLI
ncbi:hypothetical protein AAHA92_12254 [Salvia divinorum]|uniref:Uncharacterized protein n=1 Tax=Salvia divinorum TaxID=28513 RepID=A0ABD1HKF3_SALDI